MVQLNSQFTFLLWLNPGKFLCNLRCTIQVVVKLWSRLLTRKESIGLEKFWIRVILTKSDIAFCSQACAVNKLGSGPECSTGSVTARNPFRVPSPPEAVDIHDISEGSVTLAWSEPGDDGGQIISGYYVEMRLGAEGNWIRLNNEALSCDTFHYFVSGLQRAKEYYFRSVQTALLNSNFCAMLGICGYDHMEVAWL